MPENKKDITLDNIGEWLASTGLMMPTNEVELARFQKLFSDVKLNLIGNEIDPGKILRGEIGSKNAILRAMPTDLAVEKMQELKMVARNGGQISQHILDKIKKNQEKKDQNDNSSQTPGTDQ